jgi:hypothetical protein
MSRVRRFARPALAALLLACVAPGGGGAPARREAPPVADARGRPAHLVLVSVAGLTPDRYLDGEDMPVLAALARIGAAAEDVEPVAPAATYPAHATLVTGVPPSEHGIAADNLLGDRGVRAAPPAHASQLRAPALWQRVAEAGGAVASFDWPTTTGAAISLLLPDVVPLRSGEHWATLAADASTAWIAERVRAAPPAADAPGPARDALLVDLACAAFAQRAPRLMLLRLRGAEPALASAGPRSDAAASGFAAVDAELERLVRCAGAAGAVPDTAFAVVGDRALEAVHTAVRPNVWLREAGWITAQGRWTALVRSNGSSGFVYADAARTALQARTRLEAAAAETGVLRIVSADEMIARGADPDAWFGLQAEPGFVLENDLGGPPLGPAPVRGAGGWLTGRAAPAVGFVAFGHGVRRGVIVPRMHQLDVAPTLAALLGVPLEKAKGRRFVGLLRGVGAAGGR